MTESSKPSYRHERARTFRSPGSEICTVGGRHPNDYYRIDGIVANLPEFAQAFFCKATDPMVRPAANRCKIW